MFEVLEILAVVFLSAVLVIAVGFPVVSFCEKVKKEMEAEDEENKNERT